MDPYVVNMMSGASVFIYISLVHARMIAHMKYRYSRFYSHMVRTYIHLWALLTVASWSFVISHIELRNIQLTSA